jgi:hypothetical protein
MGFDAALGPAEFSPRKHLQAQTDGGRIQRQQLVFETKLLLAQPQSLFVTEPPEGRIKQLLIQLRGPVLVGISQGGFIRRYIDSEMNQLAQTTGEPLQISRRESA